MENKGKELFFLVRPTRSLQSEDIFVVMDGPNTNSWASASYSIRTWVVQIQTVQRLAPVTIVIDGDYNLHQWPLNMDNST